MVDIPINGKINMYPQLDNGMELSCKIKTVSKTLIHLLLVLVHQLEYQVQVLV